MYYIRNETVSLLLTLVFELNVWFPIFNGKVERKIEQINTDAAAKRFRIFINSILIESN